MGKGGAVGLDDDEGGLCTPPGRCDGLSTPGYALLLGPGPAGGSPETYIRNKKLTIVRQVIKPLYFLFVSNTDLKTHRHTPTELLWEKALDGIKLEVLFGSRGRKASAK